MVNFVNPLFLWALPAVSIPIIIHLLNRRRFRRMDWAAMEFLKAVVEQNRRRLLWEHLLLLALRCLVVLGLVLVFARPFSETPLLGLDFVGKARLRGFVLVDHSPSMGREAGARASARPAGRGTGARGTLLSQAAAQTLALCRTLARHAAGATMEVRSPWASAPVIRENPARREAPERVRAALATLKLADRAFDPAAALEAIAESTRGAQGTSNIVFVLSDFQRPDWTAGGAGLKPEVAAMLRDLGRSARVVLVNLAPPSTDNASLAGIETVEKVVFAGYRTQFAATVRNWTDASLGGAVLRVTTDGTELPAVNVPPIPARGAARVPFSVVWTEAGDPTLTLRLERPDGMEFDNSLERVVRTVGRLPVLLVGNGGFEARRGEAFYLSRAIDPQGYAVRTVTSDTLAGIPLRTYAAVFVVDVPTLGGDTVAALRKYVLEGGSLVFVLGRAVDENSANAAFARLFGTESPPRVGGTVEAKAPRAWRLADIQWEDELFKPFENWKFLYQAVRFRAFRKLTVGTAPNVRLDVPARFDDPDGSPALVRCGIGKGHVLVLASCADDDWTDWPVSEAGRKSYVVTVDRLLELYSGAAWNRNNYPTATPLSLPLALNEFEDTARWVRVVQPGERAASPKTLKARYVQADDQWVLSLDADDTARAGFYRLERTTRTGEKDVSTWSFHVPSSESDPTTLRPEDVAGLGPNVTMTDLSSALGGSLVAPRREYWKAIALAAALLMFAESLLAFRIGNPGRGLREE